MEDIMLDLETMGVDDDAPILSIGACYFDINTGEIGDIFYREIELKSVLENKNYISSIETMQWWMKQTEGARLLFQSKNTAPLREVLLNLCWFIKDESKLWGNGISFDIGKIKYSMGKEGIVNPVAFYNERDVRTIVDLGQRFGVDPKNEMVFQGVKHNALDDAIHQAKYVSAINMAILGVKND
jgi:hypothetical protein